MQLHTRSRSEPHGKSRPNSFGDRDSFCLIPFDRREGITIAEAAYRTGKVARTLRRWCEEWQIGRRVGGQWIVSIIALEMFLNDDAAALRAYLAGDRRSACVVGYFERAGIAPVLASWGTASS